VPLGRAAGLVRQAEKKRAWGLTAAICLSIGDPLRRLGEALRGTDPLTRGLARESAELQDLEAARDA